MTTPRGLTLPSSTWELPDLVPLYAAIRARLTGQVELDALHRAPGRIYLEGEQPPGAERDAEETLISATIQWGRTIVAPWQDLGERAYEPTIPTSVAVNLREEQGAIERTRFRPRAPLSIAHRLMYRLLDGWTPAVAGLIVGPLWLANGPTDMLWDETDRVWYETATWRTDIVVP